MENYFTKISNCCANPFIVGLIIIFVINIIIIFVPYTGKNGKTISKKLFRSSFYQYIFVIFVLYLHHNRIEYEYKQKYESDLKLDLISKTGSSEDMIEPVLKDTPIVQDTEDEFI